ncbi:MAG: lipopolysaccharide kinase InaA family protein [Candidatus Binatia bacterium]
MPSVADYGALRSGNWDFWVLRDIADAQILERLAAIVDRQPYSKHPQTLPFTWPPDTNKSHYFLKVFHRRPGLTMVKDLLRPTKARRFWQQGLALNAAGFAVPLTVLFGERRHWGSAESSLVLTEKIDGQPAPVFLSGLTYSRDNFAQVKRKRSALVQLGQMVRRFHDLGFVHGDLVATNIFISGWNADFPDFYLMDNDRTRLYSPWLTGKLRKRNLVQLNRLPLAHITLQDRLRFLHAYLGVVKLTKRDCRFARWLEARTRQRRNECDGIDPNGSFRKLMCWVPDRTSARNG